MNLDTLEKTQECNYDVATFSSTPLRQTPDTLPAKTLAEELAN
jgi:hypothetical protein